ncbi:MAG: hypothetical protein ABI780_13930 [Ardenticatenales bacterium]
MAWPDDALARRDGRLAVTVLGLGWVGSAVVGRLLAHTARPLDINVVEPNELRRGAYLDLAHTAGFHPAHRLRWNDDEAFRAARAVFHAAGNSNAIGASRRSVAAANVAITRSIFTAARFRHEPFVIVIANPVDVIAWHTWRTSGLDAARVIGTGTLLESARLAYYLGDALGVQPAAIDAWVLGEHGDAQVPVFSRTTVDGRPVRTVDAVIRDPAILARCAELTRTAAGQVRQAQPGTWWAVSDCADLIFRCLIGEADRRCPVGVRIEGAWAQALGVDDGFLGLPARLRQGGIDRLEPDAFGGLDEGEWGALRVAARGVAEACRWPESGGDVNI